MRYTMILCVFLVSLTSTAQLKNKKYSFYLQGGYRSSLYIHEASKHRLHTIKESHQHKCIVLNTGLQFYWKPRWRIGTSFTYDHFGTQHRSLEFSNLSYLLRCDRIWTRRKEYDLYSGVMTGITVTRRFDDEVETGRDTKPGYHIYLMGIEYKLMKNVSLDANVGWGVAGLFNMGAQFKF
jgi:hypothetical protein